MNQGQQNENITNINTEQDQQYMLNSSQTSDVIEKSTDFQVQSNLFKGFMGIAITNFRIYLNDIQAKGVKNSGILAAILLAPLCSFCVYFCISILLQIADDNPTVKFNSLGSVVIFIFGRDHFLSKINNILVIMLQAGVCIAYANFFKQFFVHLVCYYKWEQLCGDLMLSFLITIVILSPLAVIKTMQQFTQYNYVANLMLIISLSIVTSYAIEILQTTEIKQPLLVDFNFVPILFGQAVFAQEAICIVFELRNSAKNPLNYNTIVRNQFILQAILFVSFPCFWYLAFNDSIDDYILLRLDSSRPLHLMAQIFYMILLLVSTPLQMFPIMKICDNTIDGFMLKQNSPQLNDEEEEQKLVQGHQNQQIKSNTQLQQQNYLNLLLKNIFRVFTTILIIIIAYLVPDITSFLGLVGSMVSTILGFINPVLMYQKYYKEKQDKSFLFQFSLYFCLTIGILGGIIGTYFSMEELIIEGIDNGIHF